MYLLCTVDLQILNRLIPGNLSDLISAYKPINTNLRLATKNFSGSLQRSRFIAFTMQKKYGGCFRKLPAPRDLKLAVWAGMSTKTAAEFFTFSFPFFCLYNSCLLLLFGLKVCEYEKLEALFLKLHKD